MADRLQLSNKFFDSYRGAEAVINLTLSHTKAESFKCRPRYKMVPKRSRKGIVRGGDVTYCCS